MLSHVPFGRFIEALLWWCDRIAWVELVHITLRGDQASQSQHAAWMSQCFENYSQSELASMSYPSALRICKEYFAHLPRKLMKPSLSAYLNRMLNYLTEGVVLGVSLLAEHW